MLFRGLTGRYEPDKMRSDYEVVPNNEIVGWRGQCSCGWQGDRWERVASPTAADFNRRRHYISPDDSAHASLIVEDAIHNEWKAHVAPSEALLGLEAAAREYNRSGHRLAKTVAAAKATGASWADIARAVGISRQSAHERWADKATPLRAEEPQRRPPDGH